MIATIKADGRNSEKFNLLPPPPPPYHDVSFQELGRLQGDAYAASVAWTDVTGTKQQQQQQGFGKRSQTFTESSDSGGKMLVEVIHAEHRFDVLQSALK